MNKVQRLMVVVGGGALSLLAAQTYQQYQQEMRAASRRLLVGSRVAETARGPIEYAISGEGPPVLVAHGGGGGYDQGLVAAKLLGEGFQYIAVSRFGYLRSPLPADPSPAAQADAYVALLDALGIERVAVLAASAGGPSAQQFALRYPERCTALILGAAASQMVKMPAASIVMLQVLLRANFLFWLMLTKFQKLLLAYVGISPEVQARLGPEEWAWFTELMATLLPIDQRREGLVNDVVQATSLSPYALEQIRVPTLVIHAKDDPIAPYSHGEYSAQRIPGARFLSLEEGGHFAMGDPDTLKEAQAFLRQHV
jgi:2-hydroxy-6-oxonona-2,4-dienedioate hydrolase